MRTPLNVASSRSIAFLIIAAPAILAGCRSVETYPETFPPPASEPQKPAAKGGTGGTRTGGTGGRATGGAGAAGGSGGSTTSSGGVTGTPSPTDSADGPATQPTDTLVDAPPTVARTFTFDKVATWRGATSGAYTILFESVCDMGFIGNLRLSDPALKAKGIKAAYSVISQSCETGKHWPAVKALFDSGNEILNQGLTGRCIARTANVIPRCGMGTPTSNNFAMEIDMATTLLMQRTGAAPGVFIFPYDVCDPAAVTHIKGKGFLGSRCGAGTINPPDFADPYAVKFDLWGPAHSGYAKGAAVCAAVRATTTPAMASADCRKHVLTAALDEAAAKNGWVVRGFHGIANDASFESISEADFKAHVDVVADRVAKGALWVAGPNEIIKYRFARQQCAAPTIANNTLTFAAPSADCMKNATALSYVVNVTAAAEPAALFTMQGEVRRPARRIAPGSWAVDADPTKGPAQIVE